MLCYSLKCYRQLGLFSGTRYPENFDHFAGTRCPEKFDHFTDNKCPRLTTVSSKACPRLSSPSLPGLSPTTSGVWCTDEVVFQYEFFFLFFSNTILEYIRYSIFPTTSDFRHSNILFRWYPLMIWRCTKTPVKFLSNKSNTSLRQLREEAIYNCVTIWICRPESCLSYQRALVPSASGIFQINKATNLPRLQIHFLTMRVFFLQSDSLSPRLNLSCLNVFKMCWGAELDSSWRYIHPSWSTCFCDWCLRYFHADDFFMVPRPAIRWTAIWLMSPARTQEQPGCSMNLKSHIWKALP